MRGIVEDVRADFVDVVDVVVVDVVVVVVEEDVDDEDVSSRGGVVRLFIFLTLSNRERPAGRSACMS